jgi:hypothetical protein
MAPCTALWSSDIWLLLLLLFMMLAGVALLMIFGLWLFLMLGLTLLLQLNLGLLFTLGLLLATPPPALAAAAAEARLFICTAGSWFIDIFDDDLVLFSHTAMLLLVVGNLGLWDDKLPQPARPGAADTTCDLGREEDEEEEDGAVLSKAAGMDLERIGLFASTDGGRAGRMSFSSNEGRARIALLLSADDEMEILVKGVAAAPGVLLQLGRCCSSWSCILQTDEEDCWGNGAAAAGGPVAAAAARRSVALLP